LFLKVHSVLQIMLKDLLSVLHISNTFFYVIGNSDLTSECNFVDWIGLAKDRNRWRALVISVLNLRVQWNAGKLSSGLTSSGLSSSVQLLIISYAISCLNITFMKYVKIGNFLLLPYIISLDRPNESYPSVQWVIAISHC
jgi:hypothetical protein